MSLSTIPRGPRTMMVGIGLVTLYLGYSQLTAPWLNIEQKQQRLVLSSSTPENSPVFLERAEMWFREDPWVRNANARFGDGSRFMYFQNHELFNDDRSIRVEPLAMLWEENKSKVPYTLTATSAQLDASTKFKLDTNEFGSISSGQLQGDVRITGPDGLRIEGRRFSVSNNAMKVTTSQPVKFWWGPHSGIAQSGAEIDLLSSGETDHQGLMSITDVQRIRLLGRIDCDLLFLDDNAHREAVKLKISAADGFEYFVATHQATFFGFRDREILPDNQILIERPTISGGLDRLRCSMLTLQFQPAVRESGAAQKPSAKLLLASIQAEGARVEFTSLEHDVRATMSWLKYYVEERVMELSGSNTPATGRPSPVRIYQKTRILTASRALALHDANNRIHTIQCLGPGRIEPSNSSTAPNRSQRHDDSFDASWTESLHVRLSPQQDVTLKGNVKIAQMQADDAATSLSLSGDTIEMTGSQASGTAVPENEAPDAGNSSGIDLSRISPNELTATGNVLMTHNGVTGHVREKLTVSFREAPAGNDQTNTVKTVSQTANREESSEVQGTTKFWCDTAKARIHHQRGSSRQTNGEAQDVWLFGRVEVEHTGVTKDSSFMAGGNALSAKSGLSDGREVSLSGDPAWARLESRRIEGPRIVLKERGHAATDVQREVTVDGSGSIRLIFEQGLDGKILQKPSPLEIYWTDKLIYSDRTASFFGNIRAVMTNELDHKVQVTCASMKVHFTNDLQFKNGNRKAGQALQAIGSSSEEDGPIERIECNSKVVVDIDQMKNGVVESRNHAEFSDLTVNMMTGAFDATGSGSSGIIESTHPNSKDTPRTTPRAVARANTPVSTPTDAFVFVQARFIGSIEGNYKQRFVQLKQHVRGVFGPVRQMGDRIELDGLNVNELPPNTGSMRCENLSFSQINSSNGDGAAQFAMVAESNTSDGFNGTRAPCHLESSEISGEADRIMYDSSKQQFILRAETGRQATVSYRRIPGAAPETLTGQQFKYYRDLNKLDATEITGVQTAGDLKTPGR